MKRSRVMVAFAAVLIALGGRVAPAGAGASVTLQPLSQAAEGWVNGKADLASLRGKVVVVDVFTFGCFNCKNVTPNLRALWRKRGDDLAIVGIHTPETPYESEHANVVTNLKTLGIVWPVAIDNSRTLWNTYGIEYWPTQLVFDRAGHLRKTIVGDSQDAELDRTVAELIAERPPAR